MRGKVALVMKYSFDEMRVKRDVQIVDVPKDEHLAFYYEQIGCDVIDIVVNENGRDLICDDEGLLKSDNVIAEYPDGQTLAGNLVMVKGVGSEGETIFFDYEQDLDELLEGVHYLQAGELMGVTN